MAKPKMDIYIKAVDTGENSLSGIVRIKGNNKPLHVEGICSRFETKEGMPSLEDGLFFYGTEDELNKNYFGRVPFDFTLYGQSRDAQIKQWIYKPTKDERFKVPLESMGLNPSNKNLAKILFSEIRRTLPELIDRLEKVYFNEGGDRWNKFLHSFYHEFPTEDFVVTAIKNGLFYAYSKCNVSAPYL